MNVSEKKSFIEWIHMSYDSDLYTKSWIELLISLLFFTQYTDMFVWYLSMDFPH